MVDSALTTCGEIADLSVACIVNCTDVERSMVEEWSTPCSQLVSCLRAAMVYSDMHEED